MRTNETNEVKRVRAVGKTYYHRLKTDYCYICGSSENLELHHVIPLSVIVQRYKQKTNKEELLDVDVDFIIQNEQVADPENVLTLCKTHHYWVHKLFGKSYGEKIIPKVRNYIEKQRKKFKEK